MKKRTLDYYHKAYDAKLAIYVIVGTAVVISTVLLSIY